MKPIFCAIAVLLLLVSPARGQSDVSTAAVLGQSVSATVEQFGLGGVVRPNEWTPVQVSLTSGEERPRTVVVRLHGVDGDGDQPLVQRSVTVTPGQPYRVWLYFRTGPDVASVYTLTVHAATQRADSTYEVGRQLGWIRVQPPTTRSAAHAFFGIIGDRTLGLDQYADTIRGEEDFSYSSHETCTVVTGLSASPETLPDDWRGWSAFEAVLWAEGDPTLIGDDAQANAIREWIMRGGHLLVALQPVGDTWQNPANPLADLLPRARIQRIEDASLAPYEALLVRPRGADRPRLPERTVLHRFMLTGDPPPAEASEIIVGPHGCVVCRRLLGAGMVTFIGLDLTNRALTQGRVLSADAFWHRLIGKRFDILTAEEREKYQSNAAFQRRTAPTVFVDRKVRSEIAMDGQLSIGVLLGTVVFISYWLVAGPGGFTVLRRANLVRHAWLSFVATTAVFTVIAWLGATVLRQKEVTGEHLTYLDHVYGQPVQRARVWTTIFLPQYGQQVVSVGGADDLTEFANSVYPWTPPEQTGFDSFPDARPYEIDTIDTRSISVPARSTVKQFQADWLGRSELKPPVPLGEENRPRVESGNLYGILEHSLPQPLRNVKLILVEGLLSPAESLAAWRRPAPNPLLVKARAWDLGEWPADSPLDLAARTALPEGARRASTDASEYFDRLVPMVSLTSNILPDMSVGEPQDHERVAFFSMLAQPDYTLTPGTTRFRSNMNRRITHDWGLGKWFTQPCIIIVGSIEGPPSPVPLKVDGRNLKTRGTTVLRWIYPLEPNPPIFGGEADSGPANLQTETE